jgi:uncharacterized membrane protein YidH (DUF202 family)
LQPMELVKPPRKTLFVLVWGVLGFGCGTALLSTFVDLHAARHLTPSHFVLQFAINMSFGVLMGHLRWERLYAVDRKKMARSETAVRFVLFAAIMVVLAYVFWKMSHS